MAGAVELRLCSRDLCLFIPSNGPSNGRLRSVQQFVRCCGKTRNLNPRSAQLLTQRAAAAQAPQGVRRVPQELASLLVKRNELAAALAGGGDAPLPPMLRDPSAWGCGRCYMVNACSVAHKVRGSPGSCVVTLERD